ncbi:cell division protein FtsA [[Haemophilus] felis]|uniref:Cell division protein FtsA n=1 Tax=[Haemophilus] felis TaxID=123822 RepID=A0A1T0BCH1_9PAST|nr:cell division protein FtsA [[Haemophilus] felis]OOS07609.1 cell division protein FtsA [[Haemophilus] felis]
MTSIVESKIIVGLEVGTSKVVALVGELLPDGVVNIIGVGSCPAKGIDKGNITDLNAVVTSVKNALELAEYTADCQILSVMLAITGEHIQSWNDSGAAPILNDEVTQEDIDAALHTASSIKMPEGLTLLHRLPQEYAVDQQKNIKNPLGFQGGRLTANVHLIACHQDWLNNLKRAVERCHLKIDKVIFSGIASSHSVLTEDEKDAGVCLIDFGAGTMEVMVYTNGSLRFSKVIPYAGNRVTADIAYDQTTSHVEAENIKVKYGSAVSPPLNNPNDEFDVMSIDGRVTKRCSRARLAMVSAARYEELLSLVKKELITLKNELEAKQIKFELIAGIVITGGGAQIKELKECAMNVFGVHVRIGTPLNITGITAHVENKPQYATVLGLLQYDYSTNDEPIEDVNSSGSLQNIWNSTKKIAKKIASKF